MNFSIKSLSIAACIGSLALAGCAATEPGRSARGPSLPNPGADQEYQVTFPDPGHGSARYIGIMIDEDLSKSCGLMRTHFAFDSATLSSRDQETLRSVVECLGRPEIKDLQLSIVGHADSRGNDSHNADLSRRRAESVKNLLIGAGIAPNRISVAAPGEAGAVGSDEPSDRYSHGYDRRVDVILVGVRHTPL